MYTKIIKCEYYSSSYCQNHRFLYTEIHDHASVAEQSMVESEKLSQADKGLRALRTLVLSGEFPANARLPEVALAKRLDISRTPLREAMARLVEEGLLERNETGGCRVATFTMNDIMDAIEIRGVMEGTAARMAAERGINADQVNEGHSILNGIDKALSDAANPDFEKYVLLNARFHELLSQLAGSAMIKREVDRAQRLPLASPSAFLNGQELIPDFKASLAVAQSQHWAIFEAIENREGARAESMAREHARVAHKNVKYITQEKPGLVNRVPGLALVES